MADFLVYSPTTTGPNFKDLQDEVIAHGYGERDRSYIKTYLQMANREVCAKRRWRWLQTFNDITTTANASYNNISSLDPTLAWFAKMRPADTESYELREVKVANPEEWVTNRADPELDSDIPTGKPIRYYLWRNRIYWDPIPDDAYTYRLYYWRGPNLLSADGDLPLMPQEHRGVLVYGALMHLKLRANDTLWRDYKTLYDELLQQMYNSDLLVESQTANRVSLPERYRYQSRRVRGRGV